MTSLYRAQRCRSLTRSRRPWRPGGRVKAELGHDMGTFRPFSQARPDSMEGRRSCGAEQGHAGGFRIPNGQ